MRVVSMPVPDSAWERLATAVLCFELLEAGPTLAMLEGCVAELPASWKNSSPMDKRGYRHCLLRQQDLALLATCRSVGDELAASVLFLQLKRQLLQLIGASGFSMQDARWSAALLCACSWAVEFAKSRGGGGVDLYHLARCLRHLGEATPAPIKVVLELLLAIKDALRTGGREVPGCLRSWIHPARHGGGGAARHLSVSQMQPRPNWLQ